MNDIRLKKLDAGQTLAAYGLGNALIPSGWMGVHDSLKERMEWARSIHQAIQMVGAVTSSWDDRLEGPALWKGASAPCVHDDVALTVLSLQYPETRSFFVAHDSRATEEVVDILSCDRDVDTACYISIFGGYGGVTAASLRMPKTSTVPAVDASWDRCLFVGDPVWVTEPGEVVPGASIVIDASLSSGRLGELFLGFAMIEGAETPEEVMEPGNAAPDPSSENSVSAGRLGALFFGLFEPRD